MLATLSRFAVRRRRTVILGWVVLLVGLGTAVGALGTGFTDDTTLPSSDSATAYSLLGEAGSDAASGTSGTIVWQSAAGATGDAARADIAPMLIAVGKVAGVASVSSPFDTAGASQVSADGRTAFARVTFDATDHADDAKELAEDASTSAVRVQTGGTAFTNKIPSEIGEIIGVLAALIVLLLVFRSVWAAALPVVTGVAGVGLSTVAVMLLTHALSMSTIVLSMSALVGLGVGIDYALFIVHRQRQALRAGADVATATATAMSTSGRAVLFAGVTVIIALLGMLVLGVGFLTGIAVAAAVTVALTVVAATTLLPALLGVAGTRVLRKRDRAALADGVFPADFDTVNGPKGLWSRWARVVRRRPKLAVVTSLAVLVTLAVPAVALRLGASDASSDPSGTVTRSYHDTMAQAFGDGFESQLLLVAQTPDAASTAAWTALVGRLPGVDGVAAVSPAAKIGASGLSIVSVTPTTTSQDEATSDLVTTLRDDLIPGSEAGTRLEVHVGGTTATTIDFSDALTSKLPVFLVIVGILGFLLLMLAFRSLLVPTIGALGNLLTIAVALGATVAIFQWGWGPAMFGIGGGAPLEYVVAMLIVGVVFGLSMDYHVFLVSRMHEEWTRTGDHHRSVDAGVSDTGQVIATAATIMGLVFASFGFAGMRTASEFGVGLAVAVLADAFILRLTLVPALMHLIGRRTWSLPRSLDRVLPHVSVEGAEPAPVLEFPHRELVGGGSR